MVTSKCWTNWLKNGMFSKIFLNLWAQWVLWLQLSLHHLGIPINLHLCDQCNRFVRLMLLSIRMNIFFPLIFIKQEQNSEEHYNIYMNKHYYTVLAVVLTIFAMTFFVTGSRAVWSYNSLTVRQFCPKG